MNHDDEMAAQHNRAMGEIWQQAEEALKASRNRPLTEDEISLIGWCGNLDTSHNSSTPRNPT